MAQKLIIRVLEEASPTYPAWSAILPNSSPPKWYVFKGDSLAEQKAQIQKMAELMKDGDQQVLEEQISDIVDFDSSALTNEEVVKSMFQSAKGLLYDEAELITATGDSILESLAEVGTEFLALLV